MPQVIIRNFLLVPLHYMRKFRSWSNQGKFATHNSPELRELIYAGGAQDPAHFSYALFALLGRRVRIIGNHRSEFGQGHHFSPLASTVMGEEKPAAVFQLHGKIDYRGQDQGNDKEGQGYDDIHCAFKDSVDGL